LTRGRAALEVLLCSGYPTQLALIGVLASLGIPATVDNALSPAFVFALSGLDTLLLLGLVLAFLRASNESPARILLGEGSRVRELSLGILLVPAVFGVVIALQLAIRAFAPSLHNVPVNPFEAFLESPLVRAAFILLVVIAGGVREELQRAFLLHRFEQRLGGGLLGLVVTSTAFGLGHTLQGWDAAVVTGALGAFWSAVYLTRRSALANVVSHAIFNVTQVLAGLSSGVPT
jgi:membrane protease YdiL (CAAX protease family)